jgi:hypothetical protein
MQVKLEFSSVEEVKEFVGQLKGKRGPKGGDDENTVEAARAPTPVMPPAPAQGFAPQQSFGGFPGAGMHAVAPEVATLVQRISVKIDAAIASGQSTDSALNWFRQRCGPEAAAATLDQIKTVYLAKLSIPHLEETAKLMRA